MTATARAVGALPNPHERNIEYDPAIPTAAPAGVTMESAVDACVITRACLKPRPGSAAIQLGGNVTMFSTVAPASRSRLPAQLAQDLPDIAVVGDPRKDEHEDRADHDGSCATAEDSLSVLSPAPSLCGGAVGVCENLSWRINPNGGSRT